MYLRQFTWLAVILTTVLAGCSSPDPLPSALDEYRQRLARVLDDEAPTVTKVTLLPLATETWQQALPELSINLREFFGLRECSLSTLVAERNTVLGKTQLPSQRLFYESQLINALAHCADTVASSAPETSIRLRQWHEQKLAAWPQQWAQFVEQSDELVHAFTLRVHSFDEKASGGSESLQALQYISARHKHTPWSLEAMETHLNVLTQQRFFARLWVAQAQLQHYLDALNPWLAMHLPKIACPAGKASQNAEILRNVFYLFFIEKIQPIASQLNRYQYLTQPVIADWLTHPYLHPSLKHWLEHQTQFAFGDYQASMNTHITQWQTLFSRCHLSPKSSS